MPFQEIKGTIEDLLNAGRYHAAVAACDKALSEKRAKLDRVELLLLKTEGLVQEDGRWNGPAMESLKQAFNLTKTDSVQRARVLMDFTAAYAALGALSHCRQARDSFVELYQLNPIPAIARMHPSVEFNLAVCHHEVELLDEAESAYLFALKACVGASDPQTIRLKLLIQHNLVDVFQELNWHEQARSLMDLAYNQLPDAVYGAQIRNRMAIYALFKQDFSSAVLWVESGLGHPACDIRTRAALLLTKAKIAHGQSRVEIAHDLALEARRLATAAISSRLCDRISRFLNRL